MIIMPAIELKDGKSSRPVPVDLMKRPGFSRDPAALAQYWQNNGAEALHIYDGDAARAGKPLNLALFRKIAEGLQIPLQVKGGIRLREHVQELLSVGVDRVVLEEQVLADRRLCTRIFEEYGGKAAASVRAENGLVLAGAWPAPTDRKASELLLFYKDSGLRTVLYKDLAADENGEPEVNVPAIVALKEATGLRVVASGGISTLLELRRLTEAGIDGCIISRALYEGTINFKNALAFARWG
ncbi:MAG: HisA/HisF-related TIM barrel protein [Bacillota bacterium]|nr:HisA/HisF-related TIM barrel protein [Bacillota bacterium]